MGQVCWHAPAPQSFWTPGSPPCNSLGNPADLGVYELGQRRIDASAAVAENRGPISHAAGADGQHSKSTQSMTLRHHFENSGNWLFRYRSFLPLLTVPVFVAGLNSFTYLGRSHVWNEYWQIACLSVSLLGLVVRALTVGFVPAGTSGRNTREQIASNLNSTGMYSLVRHPLYLGNYLILLGILLFFHSWWLVLLVTCLFALYYERIMFAEEAFLHHQFGETFERWAAATPAIFPAVRQWKRPQLPFCWRTVLRREYTGLFLITTVFFVLDLVGDSLVEHRLVLDWRWVLVALIGLLAYATLRTLKKRTQWLLVVGR
jgi:protein-S-isoprenylcysteine O-methyltransferase Ste14